MGFSLPGPLGISAAAATRIACGFQTLARTIGVPNLPFPILSKCPGPVGSPSTKIASPTKSATSVATVEIPAPAPKPLISSSETTVDSRSEKTISTLLDEVRPYARKLVLAAAAQGITIKIISGLRTYAEQDALYNKGRTTKGGIVTNAKGGHSNHNFGIAFDIGVFVEEKYITTASDYDKVGPLGSALGLEWGGNWKFKDRPHYQLRPQWAANLSEPEMLKELRRRKAEKLPVFTPT